MDDIISKFTNHLKNVLTRALCLVVEKKDASIDPSHLFWALATQEGCIAAEILEKAGINSEMLSETSIEKTSRELSSTKSLIPALSKESKIIIEKAVLTANVFEHKYIGTEHLLSALLQTRTKEIEETLKTAEVDVQKIKKNLATIFKTTTSFPNTANHNALQTMFPELDKISDEEDLDESSDTPALDFFTDELTAKEHVKNLDPLIGRSQEVMRMMKILSRRHKNNPILVGEPGVGKTAIVEGLAKKIVEGTVPPTLLGKQIFRLDMASLLAGTMYRGEFESRLRQLIDEIKERKNAVLFIDEVHTISGAGATSGSLDAANILKPALARGEIRCIGATTPSEYKKFIETDGALERRFQKITVNEPSLNETRKIITGICEFYENFHGVKYTQEAIEATLQLADRYLTDRKFPDKAIDILDEAGAASVITRKNKPKISIEELEEKLAKIQKDKKQAANEDRFEDALSIKRDEDNLLKNIENASRENKQLIKQIREIDIIKIVAESTGIPLATLSASAQKQLLNLEKRLAKEVIGQEAAILKVASAVKRAKVGIQATDKPLASFLFIGPTGVGKTELAKTLAGELFKKEDAFLRLDMSEYSAPFTVSKLVGSPAGYVGYRENTKLTDFVKEKPHCIVLFDELEKAHSDVHNLLLQILDDGMLTDATGRKINFRNTIIIITSNEGSEFFEKGRLGFNSGAQSTSERDQDVQKALIDKFRKELVNRIDNICTFEPLEEKALEKIAKKQLIELKERLQKMKATLTVAATVTKTIAKKVDKKFGARDVRRIIEKEIEQIIAQMILSSDPALDKNFRISSKNSIITVYDEPNRRR